MAFPTKKRLYNKALRILAREMNLLDKKSRGGELASSDRKDLVNMMRLLEVEIKVEEKEITGAPSEALLRRAERIIEEFRSRDGTQANDENS